MTVKGFRKWSVAVLALATAFVLAYAGKLTGDFVMIVTAVVGAFTAGNTLLGVTQQKSGPTDLSVGGLSHDEK